MVEMNPMFIAQLMQSLGGGLSLGGQYSTPEGPGQAIQQQQANSQNMMLNLLKMKRDEEDRKREQAYQEEMMGFRRSAETRAQSTYEAGQKAVRDATDRFMGLTTAPQGAPGKGPGMGAGGPLAKTGGEKLGLSLSDIEAAKLEGVGDPRKGLASLAGALKDQGSQLSDPIYDEKLNKWYQLDKKTNKRTYISADGAGFKEKIFGPMFERLAQGLPLTPEQEEARKLWTNLDPLEQLRQLYMRQYLPEAERALAEAGEPKPVPPSEGAGSPGALGRGANVLQGQPAESVELPGLPPGSAGRPSVVGPRLKKMAENAGIPADILDRAERDQTTRQDVDSLTPAQLDALEAWLRGIGKR